MLYQPTLNGDSVDDKRQEIRDYFNSVYSRYESLFTLIKEPSGYYERADTLRHPLIFYYGHTATFFINKLKLARVIKERIDPTLESIFAVGVDEMSWDDLDERHYKWPSLEKTQEYRDTLRELINTLIDTLPLSLPITQSSPWWIILMGIEHENIHIETSSVLIRQLPLESIRESKDWDIFPLSGVPPTNTLIDIEGGEVELGRSVDGDYYGWDNEYGLHKATVAPFKASKYLVSNEEYLQFIRDGGYSSDSYWSIEGREWREFVGAIVPTFWIIRDGEYKLRTLTREIVLPLDWPVEVNFHEAEAFCSWLSGKRGVNITLPTEDEYMRLVDISDISKANISLEYYASSTPIDIYNHGELFDVVGNVWQWSRTPIYPYSGFEVHPIYDDFTVPTYDGKHNLIKGGSWASCGNVASTYSRYAFRRHFFQHAGFRYVQSDNKEEYIDNSYESDKSISIYCHFDWGESYLDMENFSSRSVGIILDYLEGRPKGRALDLGCMIGRSSFELAREFDSVVGIDFSTRFIQNAQRLKELGLLRYLLPIEGDIDEFYEVNLGEFGLEELSDRVEFWQGDATNLKPIYQGYDLIYTANLLDRLYDPIKFLKGVADRLNSGGTLSLISSYNWQEEQTPKERWIGGVKRDGENLYSIDGLKEILEPHFRLKKSIDIPYILYRSKREFRYTIAQMSIWKLKEKK